MKFKEFGVDHLKKFVDRIINEYNRELSDGEYDYKNGVKTFLKEFEHFFNCKEFPQWNYKNDLVYPGCYSTTFAYTGEKSESEIFWRDFDVEDLRRFHLIMWALYSSLIDEEKEETDAEAEGVRVCLKLLGEMFNCEDFLDWENWTGQT